MISFNALYQSWIPVIDRDGRQQELGIMETLTKAHELETVADSSPLVEFGIYRLLIAFVIDAFGINEIERIEELLGKGKFDARVVEDYVSSVGINRFDLFDTEHPFLQSPPSADEKADKSVAELFQHLPTGTFATHFHHAGADEHAFSPATCLKGLVTIAPFVTAGGQGLSPSINGNPPWYVLIRGKNLFEKILFNCYAKSTYELSSLEGPSWRSSMPVPPKREKTCDSLLEALTWRPRKVLLFPSDGGLCTYSGAQSDLLVRKMVFSHGFMFRGQWIDPQVAYMVTDKGVSPLKPKEEREIWRDTGAFLIIKKDLFTAEELKIRFDRPLIVEQYLTLQKKKIIPRGNHVLIEVFGMRTSPGQKKFFEWQHESLRLPDKVAHHPGAAIQIQNAMALADLVEYCLGKALKMAYPREGAGNSNALNNIIRAAKQSFWSNLHPKFEDTLIAELNDQDPVDLDAPVQLAEQWKTVLRQVGRKTFAKAVEPFDQDAEALRRLVNAENYFSLVLRFSKPSKDKKEGRKKVS